MLVVDDVQPLDLGQEPGGIMAKSKSASRRIAVKKKSVKKKSAKKKVAAARKKRTPTRKTAAPRAGVSPAIAELNDRIGIARNNLRDLTEQGAGYSGGATEELLATRITGQEEKLRQLTKQRDELVRRGAKGR
jgi:hypothetical protein